MQVKNKLRLWVSMGAVAVLLATVLVVVNNGTSPPASSAASGTLTFAEAPATTPNYIFPFMSCTFFSVANINEFDYQLYRPVYWFGLGTSAAVQPALSLANLPVMSNGNKTATIKMKGWKFADGQTINAQSVMFWLNLYKAAPKDYCGYNAGYGIPDQVKSASGSGNTVTINFTTSVNPNWILYNYLAELSPMANSWDITAPGKTSTCATGSYGAKATNTACLAVYKYLNGQSSKTNTFTDAMWQGGVSGPWKLTSFDNLGNVTFVPNTKYSGPQKAQVAQVKLVAFTSATAEQNALRAGSIDIGYVDNSVITKNGTPTKPGPNWSAIANNYNLEVGPPWSVDYAALNLNKLNPQAPMLQQLYIRQVLQLTVNQPGMIDKILKGYGYEQINPLPPVSPASVSAGASKVNPYPYSPTKASALLKSHGWVMSGGVQVCQKPGTAATDCGAGITKGEKLAFSFLYDTGTPITQLQVNAEVAEWKTIGIATTVSSAPFNTVIAECSANSAKWSICWWGAGWIYSPEYYPSGETLYVPGASFNIGAYSNAALTASVKASTFGSASLKQFANLAAVQLPDLYEPSATNSYVGGGIGEVLKTLKSNDGFAPNPLQIFLPEYYHF